MKKRYPIINIAISLLTMSLLTMPVFAADEIVTEEVEVSVLEEEYNEETSDIPVDQEEEIVGVEGPTEEALNADVNLLGTYSTYIAEYEELDIKSERSGNRHYTYADSVDGFIRVPYLFIGETFRQYRSATFVDETSGTAKGYSNFELIEFKDNYVCDTGLMNVLIDHNPDVGELYSIEILNTDTKEGYTYNVDNDTIKDLYIELPYGHYEVSYFYATGREYDTRLYLNKYKFDFTKGCKYDIEYGSDADVISQKSLASDDISVATKYANYAYTGYARRPAPIVTDGDKVLVKDKDFTVSYKNNKDIGTATMTVEGIGAYTGSKSCTFKIRKSLLDADITAGTKYASYAYTGSARKPAVTVKWGDKVLTKGTDYYLTYSNNTNAGTATITVTSKGDYMQKKTITFKLTPKAITASTVTAKTVSSSYAYTGKARQPQPVVMDSNKKLVKGTDYTLSYKNNVKAGTATVTITGKGNYKGSRTLKFTIK